MLYLTRKILDFNLIYIKTRITNDSVRNLQQCKLAPYPQGYMYQTKSFLLNKCWASQPDISSSTVNFKKHIKEPHWCTGWHMPSLSSTHTVVYINLITHTHTVQIWNNPQLKIIPNKGSISLCCLLPIVFIWLLLWCNLMAFYCFSFLHYINPLWAFCYILFKEHFIFCPHF